MRLAQRARQRTAGRFGQAGVTLGQQRHGLRIEDVAIVEQADARFADETSTLGNVGEPGDERRLPRARQHDGFVVTLASELQTQRTAPEQCEVAMAERAFDHAVDFGHAAQQRRAPGGCEDVDACAAFAQAHQQRLGDDRVADPGWGDD